MEYNTEQAWKQQVGRSHAGGALDLSSQELPVKGPRLVRRSTVGVPGEQIKLPKKSDAGSATSKFKATVGRVILAEQAVSAFKKDKHFEADEDELPDVEDEDELWQVWMRERSQGAITAHRWLFMDARRELTKRKEKGFPKNPGERLKQIFLIIRQAIRRQELKRRVVNIFWEALFSRSKLPNPETVLPALSAAPSPEPEKTPLDFGAGKLHAIRKPRVWIEDPAVQQQRRMVKEDAQKHIATMGALSESSQNRLDELLNLRQQIQSGLMIAKAMENSMAHLLTKPWVLSLLPQTQDKLQSRKGADAGQNEENGEYETKHGNVEEEKEWACVEEPEKLSERASDGCLSDMESDFGDSVVAPEAAGEDPGSCSERQQPVQARTPGSKQAKEKTQDSSKLAAAKKPQGFNLRVNSRAHRAQRSERSISKASTASAPGVLESTEPMVEAESSEEFCNQCSENLALVEALLNELMESNSSTLAGSTPAGETSERREDNLSPGDEDNEPAVTPAAERTQEPGLPEHVPDVTPAEQTQEPVTVAIQPLESTQGSVEVHEATVLAESDEQPVQTEEPTIAVVQHRELATTIVAEESESVTAPSCSSPAEMQTSKSGTGQLRNRSSTSCVEAPSGDKCGSSRPMPRSPSQTALRTSIPGSGSRQSSKASGLTEAPRRTSSKVTVSIAEEATRRPESKSPSGRSEQTPQRFSAETSATFNNVDAADSPECWPDLPTEAAATTMQRSQSLPLDLHSGPGAGGSRSQTAPLPEMSNETATGESAVVIRHGGRKLSLPNVRQPGRRRGYPLSSVSNPTWLSGTSQWLRAGWLPAPDSSPVLEVGSMGHPRRFSSKQASDSGTGLEAAVTRRASTKSPAGKNANFMNNLSADRMRRPSSAGLPCSSYHLVPTVDHGALLVTGTKLIGA